MVGITISVMFSRVVVLLLVVAVYGCFYLRALVAYRVPSAWKRFASQMLLVAGMVGIFALQISIMKRFSPLDARGNGFFLFILLDCGGGLAVMFVTMLKERAKSRPSAA